MARFVGLFLLGLAVAGGTPARQSKKVSTSMDGPTTCPGFTGYCSEAYVGDTCLVVCARGRNNVPQCQEDGTWTDIPRCIEHDPGVEEQVTGICPGIPGYCSLDWPGALCEFECPIGPAIRSSCTPDGTWEPYPTCEGDPRETQDGCNPCPGPDGGPRNRTTEVGGGNGGRAKAASRGNNNISRNGGKKQGGGGNRSQGNQNRKLGGTRQTSGGNRNGGRATAASKGNRNIPRNGGKKLDSGRNKSAGNQNRNGGGTKQNSGENRAGGKRAGGGVSQNNRNLGGRQNGGHSRDQNRGQSSKQPKRQSSTPNGGHIRSQSNSQSSSQRGAQSFNPTSGQSRGKTGQQSQAKKGQQSPDQSGGQSAGQCPGDELQACIDVCPGFSTQVFRACVTGCAKRCQARK